MSLRVDTVEFCGSDLYNDRAGISSDRDTQIPEGPQTIIESSREYFFNDLRSIFLFDNYFHLALVDESHNYRGALRLKANSTTIRA